MPTAQQMINRAYKLLGELASGETLSAEDSSDGLTALNAMLESWQVQRGFIYQVVQRSLSWPGSGASQTIGASGDFNVARPDRIESALVDDGTVYPLTVIREREHYDRIPDKNLGGAPSHLFYDPAYPLGVIYLYPVPGAVTLLLNTWNPLQTFTLGDDLALPPGYQWAIETSLAEILALECGAALTPELKQQAARARKAIKAINAPTVTLQTEVVYMTHRPLWNINSGE